MKYDAAIENMKMIQESMEVSLAMMGARTKNYSYPKQLEALDLAIEALQEKAERDKGCEYCTGDVDERPALINSDSEYVYLDGNGKLTLNDLDEVQLNHCPMCGRKLR